MEQQVREYLNHCSVPVSSENSGPLVGPSGPPPPPPPPPTAASACIGNRILSRNANGTSKERRMYKSQNSLRFYNLVAMTAQPTNESELQLYRVLQRANLLSYYDTFICQGGDDVQQLCEAGEEEFLEIMALVGMASKPLHVRRLQKALQEWVSNPAMFQTPLVPAMPPSHPSHSMNPLNPAGITGGGNRGPPPGGPVNLSQHSPLPLRPSPPIPMLTNNNAMVAAAAALANHHSSPSPGHKDISSPSSVTSATSHLSLGPPQPPTPSLSQGPPTSTSSSMAMSMAMSSRGGDPSQLQQGPMSGRASLEPQQSAPSVSTASMPPLTPVSTSSSALPSPQHREHMSMSMSQGENEGYLQDGSEDQLQRGSGCGGPVEYGQPSSPISLTPVLVESQIQRLSEAADSLIRTLPPFEPKPQNSKKKISKDLEYVMNMADDDPRRMDEIRKYAAIYGRFDCKRKPEKPLTLHEVSVNEAAAQICKHIPALLTRRDELFPLARQVVRDSGYQYSKGHSSLDESCRSQCYSKSFDDESSCKRSRLDPSPNRFTDKAQIEEEKKRRQERLDMIAEQLKLLGAQQEELKMRLQQARELQNFPVVSQTQIQLEQIATQQMQIINEQSELNKQIRRLERYASGGKSYGRLSTCSETDKIDTDDTDSQFSAYSNTSSPTLSHDAHDSPSQDSNQSVNATDMYSAMKMVSSAKKGNVQISKQLVQETLMDEGLRVVKELANQIKQESDMRVPPPKPEGRPRGRPPTLDRDYIKMPPLMSPMQQHQTHHHGGGMNQGPMGSASGSSMNLMPPSPVHPTLAQNGHSPMNMNGPPNSGCAQMGGMRDHGMPPGMGMGGMPMGMNMSGGTPNGLPVECIDADRTNDMSSMEVVGKSSEDSLNALLALSQKGIKQEPPSPSSSIKMD